MSRRIRVLLPALAGLALLGACASAPVPPDALGSAPATAFARHAVRTAPATAYRNTVLTAEEIAAGHPGTAYDVVRRLRPEFLLSTRGRSGGAPVAVFQNHMPVGLEYLRRLPAENVRQLRYLTAIEATALYGNQPAGAIEVTLKPD